MDMRKMVGRNLVRLREEKNLTPGSVSPTLVTIYEIATALGVHYLDLLKPDGKGKD